MQEKTQRARYIRLVAFLVAAIVFQALAATIHPAATMFFLASFIMIGYGIGMTFGLPQRKG